MAQLQTAAKLSQPAVLSLATPRIASDDTAILPEAAITNPTIEEIYRTGKVTNGRETFDLHSNISRQEGALISRCRRTSAWSLASIKVSRRCRRAKPPV